MLRDTTRLSNCKTHHKEAGQWHNDSSASCGSDNTTFLPTTFKLSHKLLCNPVIDYSSENTVHSIVSLPGTSCVLLTWVSLGTIVLLFFQCTFVRLETRPISRIINTHHILHFLPLDLQLLYP